MAWGWNPWLCASKASTPLNELCPQPLHMDLFIYPHPPRSRSLSFLRYCLSAEPMLVLNSCPSASVSRVPHAGLDLTSFCLSLPSSETAHCALLDSAHISFLNFIFGFIYFMFTRILPIYMDVYYMYAWCPWKSEEGVGAPGTGITSSCGC